MRGYVISSAALAGALALHVLSTPASASTPVQFEPPKLTMVERAAFGREAAPAPDLGAITPFKPASRMWLQGFTIGGGLVLATAGVVAFRLSRRQKEGGATEHGLTVGTALTLGLGVAGAAAITIGVVGLHSGVQQTDALRRLGDIRADAKLIDGIRGDLTRVRMHAMDFLLTNADHSLEGYSHASASAWARLDRAKEMIQAADRVRTLDQIRSDLTRYETTFDEVVATIDERNSVIKSQMYASAARTDEALSGLIEGFNADGNPGAALSASQARTDLTVARAMFFRFLRFDAPEDITAAKAACETLASHLDAIKGSSLSEERRAELAFVRSAVDFWVERMLHAVGLADKRDELVKGVMDKLGPTMDQSGMELVESIEKSVAVVTDEADKIGDRAEQMVLAIACLGVAATGLAGLVLVRSITRPLARVLGSLRAVSGGELRIEPLKLDRRDELGDLARATDEMADRLRALVGEISGATREVAAAATEIAASGEQMAAGMQRQEQQATQVSAAVEEMASTVAEVAHKSADAAAAAQGSRSDADQGNTVVRATVKEMNGIAEDVRESARAVASLGEKGEQIGAIIKVINDIADQTNLLALNAAIEAARAGEHGRGFAVVADEVRKLAERTQQATEEVSRSIREIQAETQGAVERIEAGSKRVSHGVELSASAGEALGRIERSSESLAGMVRSIAAAADQQSAASEEIARSIAQISAVTRESAEGAGQSARAATDLSRQAERLQSLVGRFKV